MGVGWRMPPVLLASEGVVALGRLSQERCGVLKRPQSGLRGLGMAIGGGGGGGGEGGSGVDEFVQNTCSGKAVLPEKRKWPQCQATGTKRPSVPRLASETFSLETHRSTCFSHEQNEELNKQRPARPSWYGRSTPTYVSPLRSHLSSYLT